MFKKGEKGFKLLLASVLAIPLFIPAVTFGEETESASEYDQQLWSAVKPLSTITSFLNTGAHPDDERSHLLSYLSRGLGVNTASIIANRGEGGQNEIGGELGDGLGIIRSREMIEASEITGVKVFHLSEITSDPIYDFGFSKSPDDTLNIWGEEVTYERLIKKIREYQPDIVMPSFRDVESQHGHHRAINQLSKRAFDDAANPEIFPEHLEEGIQPWQIKKLYLPAASTEDATIGIEIGEFDEVYGMTYPQLGEESRYLHKSQGMGNDIEPGSRIEHLELIQSSVGDIPEQEDSIFEGLSYDFNEYANTLTKSGNSVKNDLKKLQNELDDVIEAYPTSENVLTESHEALKQLRKTLNKTENVKLDDLDRNDLLHRLEVKEDQLKQVSKVASKLDVKTSVENRVLAQGGQTSVLVDVVNNGSETIDDVVVELNVPNSWSVEGDFNQESLKPGDHATIEFQVTVAEDAEYYNPYDEDVLSTEVTYEVGKQKASVDFFTNETTAVLPQVSLKANPESLAINTAQEREEITVDVTVTNYTQSSLTTDVSLQTPEGWASIESKTISFDDEETEKDVSFSVTPPDELVDNEAFELTPTATIDGKEMSTSVQEISYDHIGTFYYLNSSSIEGMAFNLQFDQDLNVGYVESGFDFVADNLAEVGMNITKIQDFATEDLSKYDTIVVGIRAYLSRSDLLENNDRLLEYVEQGGNAVVQYHKPWDNWNPETTAPFDLTLGQPSIEWRVTDENSEYEILQSEHTLLNQPNEITDTDWNGWIQDRALYYPMDWADNYETIVNMTDLDGDTFDGGILVTDYGEGSYIYTNLVWYRQIQGLVPGGYRIFTNLISYEGSQN
ncbi:PIG-L family deacetylase [Aquibacillus saliphilus]|uniref:PIG-L family deacetylase n=1 Tax=Aquibacillus saliphilus TaxID=1909422 RepID=UPI001CF092A2|nr:PIG-L family deacetylase [Aquibacillus saliphilus]